MKLIDNHLLLRESHSHTLKTLEQKQAALYLDSHRPQATFLFEILQWMRQLSRP